MSVWNDANRRTDILVHMSALQSAQLMPSSMERALAAFYFEFGLDVNEAVCRREYARVLERPAPPELHGSDLWVCFTRDLFTEKLPEPHDDAGVIHDFQYHFCLIGCPAAMVYNNPDADRAYERKHELGHDPVRDRGVELLQDRPPSPDDNAPWVPDPVNYVAMRRGTEFAVAFLKAIYPNAIIHRILDNTTFDPDQVECTVGSHVGNVYKILYDSGLFLEIRTYN